MALIADDPPRPLPRGWKPMRPLRPGCGTVSNAQLLSLPDTISASPAGVVTTQLSSLPPASSSATEVCGSSDNRLATAQPPEPPPITTKSNVSVTYAPQIFFDFFYVIPGWSEGPSLRCAMAHRGISRFSDVHLHIV